MPAPLGEPDPVEPGFGDAARLVGRQAADLGQPEHDIGERGQMREEIVALEDHADAGALMRQRPPAEAMPPASGVDAVTKQFAVEPNFSGVIVLEQIDAAQKRRLARAACPDDRDDIARKDVEIDAAQNGVTAEGFFEFRNGENRLHLLCPIVPGIVFPATTRRRQWRG